MISVAFLTPPEGGVLGFSMEGHAEYGEAGEDIVCAAVSSAAYLAANTMAGKDSLTLVVSGHEEQIIVTALFDNLGKGASGAAVQNMNIALGLPEDHYLQ